MGNSVRIAASVDDKVSGPLDRMRDKFDLMGKGAASASLVGNAGAMVLEKGVSLIGRAADAVMDEVGNAIKAASDLAESQSKAAVIFGESAAKMEAFGDTAAESLGMSKQAAIEAGATLGNFFTGIGRSAPDAEIMSEAMVKLASDLASFNNQDPTEVLQKLRSGLTGEAEPLRSVGVFLTEAKVKAKAMEMNLADAHGELTEGAKVLARYQLILEETKTAQGDFARTSDGLANTQRTTAAKIVDAEAELGKSLIPVASGLEIVKQKAIEGATGLVNFAVASHQADGGLLGLITGTGAAAAAATEAEEATAKWRAALSDAAVGVEDGGRRITAAVAPISGSMKVGFVDSSLDAQLAFVGAMDKVKGSIGDARDAIKGATDSIINDTWDPLINAAEITATKLRLADAQKEASTKGLTKTEKAEADLRVLNLKKSLDQLLADQAQYGSDSALLAYTDGKYTKEQVLAGLQSKNEDVRKHWEDYVVAQAAAHQASAAAAYTGGATVGASFVEGQVQGIAATVDEVYNAGNQILSTFASWRADGYPIGAAWVTSIAEGITKNDWKISGAISKSVGSKMIGFSPPKEGPLKDIDVGGANIAKAWVDAFAGAIDGASVASPLARIGAGLAAAPPALSGGGGVMTAATGSGAGVVNIYIDRGAFIDGPSVDALARTIAQRLNLVGVR